MSDENLPGTLDERSSGHWRVRAVLPNGTRKTATFATKEQANLFRRGLLSVQKQEPTLSEGAVTLRAYGQQWLDRREISGKHRAIHNERSQWRAHIETAAFIDRAVRDVTRKEIRAWVETLERKRALTPTRGTKTHKRSTRTLSWKTVRQILILLRQCFKDAIEREVRSDNPCDGVAVKSRASAAETWTFLTLEEIEDMRTCERIPEAHRLLFTVAIYTGLRQGELWGLHWGDVHLDANAKVIVRFSHKGPTKSGKTRHVPLLAPALESLQRLQELAGKPKADDLVFPALRGDRRKRGDDAGWSDWHHPRTKELEPGYKSLAAITRRVRFHDLRHTCASHLVMGSWGAQWTLQEVAALLGHSDVAVTQRYAHLSPDHLQRKAAETKTWDHKKGVGRGPGVPATEEESPGISAARPTRLELVTSRSVVLGLQESRRVLRPPLDHGGTTAEVARALLEAVARRSPDVGALVEALVLSVLSDDRVQLALDVLQAEPKHRARRACELASAVLDAKERDSDSETG